MKKKPSAPPAPGNVVLKKRYGNTLVLFCDDACRQNTEEDDKMVLDRIARAISGVYLKASEMQAAA